MTLEFICVVTEPTDWCSVLVPVVKNNGTVRICELTIDVRREHLMLPSLDDIAPKLAHSKVLLTLYRCSQWVLANHARREQTLMTIFITPFGRYAFRRLPFGISPAPKIFQRKCRHSFEGLSVVELIMDDILVHGRDLEKHDACLTAMIRRIDASGLSSTQHVCTVTKRATLLWTHH